MSEIALYHASMLVEADAADIIRILNILNQEHPEAVQDFLLLIEEEL